MKRLIRNAFLSTATLVAFIHPALAGNYPDRPIKMIVPFSAGGPTDAMARLLAERLGSTLGQVVTVLNKAGGDNLIAAREVVASKPDGYTLFFTTNGLLSIAPAIDAQYPIDTLKEFSYIASMSAYPYVFVTGKNEKRETLDEFIRDSRKEAGSVSYAVVGNVSLVAGALFTDSLKIDMLPVRYKGNSDTVSDLFAGRLNLGTFAPSFSVPLIEAGKFKPLAATGVTRIKQLPDLPLVSELNPALKEFSENAMVWTALVAPAGLPLDIEKKIQAAVKAVMSDPSMISKVEHQGDIVDWRSGSETKNRAVKEMDMWKRVAKSSNLKKM